MALTANALTTIASAKTELGIADNDASKDTLLERWISEASGAIERRLGRKLRRVELTEKLAGSGGPELLLSRTPVVAVTKVVLDGAELAAGDYELEDPEAGILSREAGWPASGDACIGIARTPIPGTGARNVAVTYEGGYVLPNDAGERTLPPDLERGCLETVKALFHALGRDPNVTSEQLGDYSVGFAGTNAAIGRGAGGIIPDNVLPLIDAYQRLVL
jgi:hypothetical protein